jgi:hypothetical protein
MSTTPRSNASPKSPPAQAPDTIQVRPPHYNSRQSRPPQQQPAYYNNKGAHYGATYAVVPQYFVPYVYQPQRPPPASFRHAAPQQMEVQPTYWASRPQLIQQPQPPSRPFRPRPTVVLASDNDIKINVQGPIFAIDVECIASGKTHNDREVAHIALVDGDEKLVLNLYVKPKGNVARSSIVFSPLNLL